MTLAFNCPRCGKQFQVPDNMAGSKAKCGACGAVLQVPTVPAGITATPAAGGPAAPTGRGPTPAGSATPPKPKRRTGLILAVVGLGGLLFSCCVCTGGFFGFVGPYFQLFDPLGLNYRLYGGLPPESKYLPENCEFVFVVDMEQVLASDAWSQLKKEVPEVEKGVSDDKDDGIAATDIARLTYGGRLGENSDGGVFVVKTKKKVNASEISRKKGKGKEEKQTKVKDYTIYGEGGSAFCVVEDDVMVVGRVEALRKILERNGKASYSDGLKKAMKQVSFSKSAAAAIDLKAIPADRRKGLLAIPGMREVGKIVEKAEAATFQVSVKSEIEAVGTVQFPTDGDADEARKLVEAAVVAVKNLDATPAEGKDLLTALQVTTSGSQLTIRLKSKADPLIQIGKKGKMFTALPRPEDERVAGIGLFPPDLRRKR
jgi:hypothetical protein